MNGFIGVRQHQIEGDWLMQRTILLLCCPIHAIPSYHNFLYEQEHFIPHHTVRAPEDAWIKWRDQHFDEEITIWKKDVLYWMTDYEAKDRLVLSYERLVHTKSVPVESTRIAKFLRRTKGVSVVPPTKIPCVRDKVVNYKRIDVDEDGNEIDEERKLTEGKVESV